jgi:glycerol-3-phosphate dehydrogenase subunit C
MIDLENISFDHCLKCTVCTIYCPVARATPLYPGPKQSGPDTERLRIKSPELVDDSLRYCNNCKRCEIACPSDVKIADIIQKGKWQYARHKLRPRDFLLSRTDLMGQAATRGKSLFNRVAADPRARRLMEVLLKIPRDRTFPKYERGTFEKWFRGQRTAQQAFRDRVVYFHGCYVNYNDHELGRRVVRVLNAMGFGVLAARQKCCGVPLIANGFLVRARLNARYNIAALGRAVAGSEMKIISASSTCSYALAHEYRNLLGLDNSAIFHRVEYLTRFIYDELEKGRVLDLKPVPLTVAYHAPCHLERVGGVIHTIEVLRRIPGLKLRLLNSECCGIAGTYGFKSEFHGIAQEVGSDLFRRIAAVKPDLVVTDCETCKWQIEMNTPYEVVHPVTLLDRALPTT